MKYLVIAVSCLLFLNCNFSGKKYPTKSYVLAVPEYVVEKDVNQFQEIISARFEHYTSQELVFEFLPEQQQLRVQAPNLEKLKGEEITEKLLTYKNTLGIYEGNNNQKTIYGLQQIDEFSEKEGWFDELLGDRKFSDIFTITTSTAFFYTLGSVKTSEDATLIDSILKSKEVVNFFTNDIAWTWMKNGDLYELSSYLLPPSGLKVDETMVETVKVTIDPNGLPALDLDFDETGTDILTKTTTKAAPTKGVLPIFLNNKLMTQPAVQSAITNGRVQITGGFVIEDIIIYEALLTNGKLPFEVTLLEIEEME